MKRYVAIVSFYVHADSEEKAVQEARRICAEQDKKRDDKCSIDEFYEQSFGTFRNKKIDHRKIK